MEALIVLAALLTSAGTAVDGAVLERDLMALMESISVSGREEEAARLVLGRLPVDLAQRDRAGNVIMKLGSGSPRRLVACGLDEPGLVVSEIRPDGFLRVRPAGPGSPGPLWAQGFEGQKVWIETAGGRVAGAFGIPSIHLFQDEGPSDEIVGPGDLRLDVGAENAEEVREQGIELLDPIGLRNRSWGLGDAFGHGLAAGPAAQSKASCAALLAAARSLAAGSVDGTLVLAWVRLDLWNRKGIEHVALEHAPFEEVLLASRGFGWRRGEDDLEPLELPDAGSGFLRAGEVLLPGRATTSEHPEPRAAYYTRGPEWGQARIGFYSVPARYRETPVEAVALADVEALAESLVAWAGVGGDASFGELAEHRASRAEDVHFSHRGVLLRLAELIQAFGVSTREVEIRDLVRSRLPEWAEPVIDEKGNLLVSFGSGNEHVAFVAHLDEVGFTVEEILEDGRLRVARQGGLSPSAWEGQIALVHTEGGQRPAVFEPREGWLEADSRRPSGDLTIFVGPESREATAGMGIEVGDAVTMPKRLARLGRHRAVARSFDDRVGSAAQLLALDRIDPTDVSRRYTFAWVVEEETGLFGSVALAAELSDLDRVHAVDTFVSSDDAFSDKGFALAPLGEGVVLRAMDNGYLADREAIDYVREVAERRGIPTRLGFTGGGNDGIAFIHNGATNLPLSWPGRSSHSPAEIMDLRDLEALVDLIVALVEDPPS